MTKLLNTTDTELGVPQVMSGPRSVMHPVNFQNIAATQAQTFERLTNLDCDGSGSPATGNEAHNHTEDHNAPCITLMCRSYGQENTGTVGDARRPLTVQNSGDDETDVVLIYSPIMVTADMVDRSCLLVMHIEGDGAPGVKVTMETWAGGPPMTPTTVTGIDRLQLRRGTEHPALEDSPTGYQLWWVRVYPPAAGLYTVKVTTDVETSAGALRTREIRSINLINEPHWGSMWSASDVRKPDLPQANMVDVGDSRNANGWTCPTDKLFPSNGAGPGMLSPGVRLLTLNDAWLQEKATGLPAAGQATRTIDPHKHTGASGDGAEIVIPVLALPVGRPAGVGHIFGNGSSGPSVYQTTYKQVLEFYIYTPDHTYALDEVAHPRLWCAVLMHGDVSKTGGVVTKITTTETTPRTSAVEFATDPNPGAPLYELVIDSTNAFTFTPGGRTKVKAELKTISGAGASDVGTLVGLCFWISATPP